MIRYANDYFIIFMNIDETMRIKRKYTGKLREFTYKITHISTANSPKAANLVPKLLLRHSWFYDGWICKLSH